ncbi:MAG: leucyl aminopeptidase family protein [Gammaproteobacteria bacterium]
MSTCFAEENAQAASIPLIPMRKAELDEWLEGQEPRVRRWVETNDFHAREGSRSLIPDAEGNLQAVLFGVTREPDPWLLGGLAARLPNGVYHLESDWPAETVRLAEIAWGLGSYRYTRYKEPPKRPHAQPQLKLSGAVEDVQAAVEAISLVRNLINTPAEDMMPQHLAAETAQLAVTYGGQFNEVVGDELLALNYPALHAVGRASSHPPRLIELTWGDPGHRQVTLVGKGVCFDSGGLDIKPASNMRMMKKDMGGSAHVLGLARWIMDTGLPVRLRVLIGAAENAIGANAFRPGDVLKTRSGKTVEVDNTDAEGRLAICDALYAASEDKIDLLIDFATLTGAARVALGTEVPVFFANDEALASGLMQASEAVAEPIWRLPLHKPYSTYLKSQVADLVNSAATPFGGAITAALFLQEFVGHKIPWAHFDIMAWNERPRPGRPKGGEAMGLLSVYEHIRRFLVAD